MGRNSYFRRRVYIYLIPVLFTPAIFSCTKPQIRFDNVNNGSNATNVVTVDTFAVQVSTVFLDSFPTSGTAAQLLGRYRDPFFGVITSRSYTDLGTPLPLPTITNISTYDSIHLILRIDRSFYGDTTKPQRLLVSQLTQVMNFPGIQTAFYNNNSIPYDPTILGSTIVNIKPRAGLTSQRKGDSLIISMPNSLGEELFGLLYRQSDTIRNEAIFRGFFKGLTVYPDTSMPGAIFGFKDTMTLRIFYHEPGVVVNQLTADFSTIYQFTQFNQITADRKGTPTELLSKANPELLSTASNNQSFFQPITSLYTKLVFPTISNLLGYRDYLSVLKAQLIIRPIQGTYSPTSNLPPLVYLSLTNQGNGIGQQIPVGNGNLTIDYLYGANTNYTYDLTGYIQNALHEGPQLNAKNGLLLTTPGQLFNTQFNRAVFGNAYNAQRSNQISLVIYYASYY